MDVNELRNSPEKARCYFSKKLAFSLGPVELKEILDKGNVTLVDVRRKEDYDISHIPGAISVPKDEIAERIGEFSKENTTIVYCYNEQCHLGARAALILAEYDFPVMELQGGFKVWTEDFRFAVMS